MNFVKEMPRFALVVALTISRSKLSLSGRPNSGMNHVINGSGDAVITTRRAIVD
jgi:hypothetical protein